MEENNNNNTEKEFSVDFDKEALKSQTKETVNQVKETFKNTDFKKEADATKGFILELISSPVTTIKSIVSEEQNRFSNAVILMVCFIATALIEYVLRCLVNTYSNFNLKTAVLYVISPIIYVLAFSASTYLLSGKNKKNITTILSGIIVGFTPLVIRNVVDIVEVIIDKLLPLGFIFNMITSALYFAGIGLVIYAIKGLITSEGNEDKDFRKVVVIAFAAYAIIYVLSRLGIYYAI